MIPVLRGQVSPVANREKALGFPSGTTIFVCTFLGDTPKWWFSFWFPFWFPFKANQKGVPPKTVHQTAGVLGRGRMEQHVGEMQGVVDLHLQRRQSVLDFIVRLQGQEPSRFKRGLGLQNQQDHSSRGTHHSFRGKPKSEKDTLPRFESALKIRRNMQEVFPQCTKTSGFVLSTQAPPLL